MDVPIKYRNASLKNATLLPPKIVEIGERWVEKEAPKSLLLTGLPGSGKTYFAYSLYNDLFSTRNIFVTARNLDKELLNASRECPGEEEFLLEKYLACPVLFIDDLGLERATERMLGIWYDIFESRGSNRLVTVITSNFNRSQILSNIGDRIGSRLNEFYNITFPNKDLRKEIGDRSW